MLIFWIPRLPVSHPDNPGNQRKRPKSVGIYLLWSLVRRDRMRLGGHGTTDQSHTGLRSLDEGRSSVALRTHGSAASKPVASAATVRSDVAVLVLALVGVAATLVHNHDDLAGRDFGVFVDAVPVVLYVGLALIGFVSRFRSAASWALLLTAWIFVITALVGLVPRVTMATVPEGYSNHLIAHALVLVMQIPLIVVLVRRLNTPRFIGRCGSDRSGINSDQR